MIRDCQEKCVSYINNIHLVGFPDFNSKNIVKLTDDNVDSFLIYKEKIYFINKTNSDKLYSMDLDGKNLKKLDDGDCSYLTILNNRLYYQVKDGDSSLDDKFKTIELDKK